MQRNVFHTKAQYVQNKFLHLGVNKDKPFSQQHWHERRMLHHSKVPVCRCCQQDFVRDKKRKMGTPMNRRICKGARFCLWFDWFQHQRDLRKIKTPSLRERSPETPANPLDYDDWFSALGHGNQSPPVKSESPSKLPKCNDEAAPRRARHKNNRHHNKIKPKDAATCCASSTPHVHFVPDDSLSASSPKYGNRSIFSSKHRKQSARMLEEILQYTPKSMELLWGAESGDEGWERFAIGRYNHGNSKQRAIQDQGAEGTDPECEIHPSVSYWEDFANTGLSEKDAITTTPRVAKSARCTENPLIPSQAKQSAENAANAVIPEPLLFTKGNEPLVGRGEDRAARGSHQADRKDFSTAITTDSPGNTMHLNEISEEEVVFARILYQSMELRTEDEMQQVTRYMKVLSLLEAQPNTAQNIILGNYDERMTVLERLEMEAKRSFQEHCAMQNKKRASNCCFHIGK